MEDEKEQPEEVERSLAQSLRPLAAELIRVRAEAQRLGMFLGDRPLLECPECRLQEDVLINGVLVVYSAQDNGVDSGLRFADLSEDRFLCPACGLVFTAPQEQLPGSGGNETAGEHNFA